MSEKDLKYIFSKNLTYFMGLRGKTQQDIIDDLGLNSSVISEYCNGKKFPRAGRLQLLSDYLGVSMHDMINDNINFDGQYTNSAVGVNPTNINDNSKTYNIQQILSEQEFELLRIFRNVVPKGQVSLMNAAYEVEKKYSKKGELNSP